MDCLLDAFKDMDYEQLERWLSELRRKRRLFEVNPETYYTTIEPPHAADRLHVSQPVDQKFRWMSVLHT